VGVLADVGEKAGQSGLRINPWNLNRVMPAQGTAE